MNLRQIALMICFITKAALILLSVGSDELLRGEGREAKLWTFVINFKLSHLIV